MIRFLLKIWRSMGPALRWRSLWLVHSKFMIGVSGVVFNQSGEVLLLRHRFWPEGSWGLPSGYLNKKEEVEAGWSRELREETGMEISNIKHLGIRSGFKLRLEVFLHGETKDTPSIVDTAEILEAKFFPSESLPEGILEQHKDLIKRALAARAS